jgi:nucleotide-binding universal stress UspA family protein
MMVLPKNHLATTVLGEYTKAIQDAQEYLASVRQRLYQDKQVEPFLEVTSSVLQQSSVNAALADIIAKGANGEENHSPSYDVIAMATHGREGLDRWLHSSVTEQVLDTSNLPILVLHPEQKGIAWKGSV